MVLKIVVVEKMALLLEIVELLETVVLESGGICVHGGVGDR